MTDGLPFIIGNARCLGRYHADVVFTMSADDIKEIVPTLPGGTKDAIASEAKKKIESGELDSRSAIKALEDSLDVELEETV